MQRRPETVAGAREMVADRGRVEAGIDPAEHAAGAGREVVGAAPPLRADEVVGRRHAVVPAHRSRRECTLSAERGPWARRAAGIVVGCESGRHLPACLTSLAAAVAAHRPTIALV